MLAICAAGYADGQAQQAPRAPDSGVYADGGVRHSWQINPAHALIWDNSPYLPAGVAFRPLSLSSDDPKAWSADENALSQLKSAGVHDLIVSPSTSLAETTAPRLQKLLNLLNQDSFRFGLGFGPGIEASLAGFLVRPAIYRFEDATRITAVWPAAAVSAAAYFVADADHNSRIVRSGKAEIRDGIASAPVEPSATLTRPVALLLPLVSAGTQGRQPFPDLWTQFDSYRDSIVNLLRGVRFGPGLRFFIDPLGYQLSLDEETAQIVPISDSFRLEWESYLARTYATAQEIRDHWRLAEDVRTVADCARLVPLWSEGRGFPYLYDPLSGKTLRVQDGPEGSWWADFDAFRSASIGHYVNSFAKMLKQVVVDVPVVASWQAGSAPFVLDDPDWGVDGLGVATVERDPFRVARGTGPAFSQGESAPRALWLLASSVDTPPSDGYASQGDLSADQASMRALGLKGFYYRSSTSANWIPPAGALPWIASTAASLAALPGAAQIMPHVLYYPEDAPGPAITGPVPGAPDIYWLPASTPGAPVDWWPTVTGYTLNPGLPQSETVLLSLQGPRHIRMLVPHVKGITGYHADGSPAPIKIINKTTFDVSFDQAPIVLLTQGQDVTPIEAATDIAGQVGVLVKVAQAKKSQSFQVAQFKSSTMDQLMHTRNYSAAYGAGRQALDVLMSDGAPYIWMEGEATRYEDFTEYAANPAASGGAYLRLSSPFPPEKTPYGARYVFSVPQDGTADVWFAGTPPGPDTSPFVWYVDNQPAQPPDNPAAVGPRYLSDYFGWVHLGQVALKAGAHSLSIRVDGKAPATGDFTLSIDAILITPAGNTFVPDGVIKPLPVDLATVKAEEKAARKK